MANFTQTLSDTISFFSTSTQWGAPMTWGVDKWGSGFAPNFGIPTNSVSVQVETPTFVDQYAYDVVMGPVSQVLTLPMSTNDEELFAQVVGPSWNYVLYQQNKNLELTSQAVYTESVVGSVSWTSGVVTTTTWT